MSLVYSLCLTVLLLVVLMILFSWLFWRRYSPLFKLPNTFWIDRQLLRRALFGDGKEEVPFKRYIFRKIVDYCRKHETEGMCVSWKVGPTLLVYGEEATKFFSNLPSLIDKPIEYKTFEFIGNELGVFTSSGTMWKTQRKLLSPAFYTRTLKTLVSVANDHSAEMVQHLAYLNGKVTDQTGEIMQNISLKTFFEATLGVKTDIPENAYRVKRLTELLPQLLEFVCYRICNPWLLFDFALKFSSVARKYLALNEELQNVVGQVLNEMKASIISRNNKKSKNHIEDSDGSFVSHHKTIGEILIEKHLEDPSFTLQHVKVQLITVINAGFDTVSATLTWTLWLLGLHQEVQDQVLAEIKSVMCDDAVKYEELYKMTYLECVIKESLRLFPVVPVFGRRLNKEIQFGKYTIPGNTTIMFVPWILHRNPKIYPDPETFYPERFIDGDSKIKPWTHIPFAEGVRSCIGKNFAMVEMKILLCHVLKNFRVVTSGRLEDAVPGWDIMLRNETPLRMQFIPR